MTFLTAEGQSSKGGYMGPALVVLAFLSAVPVFWIGLESLIVAWGTPEYSHGPLIPLISLFLFLRELRDRPAAAAPPDGQNLKPGLLVGVLALAVAWAGNLAAIPDVVAYGLILWVMALVLVAMGWTAGRLHWAPVLHLIFMLPLPQILYWNLATGLQTISAEIGVWIVRLMGVPVFLQGHIIDLGVYRLQVAEACSGLRYLFPILSFSYLVAILYRGPFSHKVILFSLAAPVAVLLNAARIGVIGFLVDRYGIGQAEGFLHVFEGWVVFGLCIVVLAIVARLLSRFRRQTGPVLDLDTAGMGVQVLRARHLVPSAGMLTLIGMTLAFGVLSHTTLRSQDIPPRVPLAAFSTALDGWSGQSITLAPDVARLLGADDYLDTEFVQQDTLARAMLFVAWYENQNQGAGIHAPEVCLPAGGWEIADLSEVAVQLDGTFTVNRAIVRRELEEQLVYFWFEQRGKRMPGDWQAKFEAIRGQALEGRADGALVRLTTPILPNETIEDAEARLQDLGRKALPQLAEHLPE